MTDTMSAQATVATNGASSSAAILSAPRDRAVSTPPASAPVGAVEYLPRRGGKAHAVVSFFGANPDEILTTADVMIKFDVREKSVRALLEASVRVGLLSTTRERRFATGAAMLVYSAGPNLPAWWRARA